MKCDFTSSLIDSEFFNGDIILTDPCYLIKDERDKTVSNHGEYMEPLGFYTYLSERTLIGDWDCDVFQGPADSVWTPQAPEKKIGSFSADACRVGVFYLKDVLKYDPSFAMHITHPWCVCWLKDFKGTVNFITLPDPDGYETMLVTGSGSLDFFSRESDWNQFFPCKNSGKN